MTSSELCKTIFKQRKVVFSHFLRVLALKTTGCRQIWEIKRFRARTVTAGVDGSGSERCRSLPWSFLQKEARIRKRGNVMTIWQPGFNFSSDLSDRFVSPSRKKAVLFVSSWGRGEKAEYDEEDNCCANNEQLIHGNKRFDFDAKPSML